jgi:phosphate transport system substrate-binding protein
MAEMLTMIKTIASAVALILGMLCSSAAAQITYVGSAPIGEHIIPEAVKAFTAKTGIPFGGIGMRTSGIGLEMVMGGEAPLAGVSRSLTLEEKQQRLYYRIIGYDAVVIYVHTSNPVTSLTKQQLKAIFTGRMTNWQEVGGADAPIVCITLDRGDKRAQVVVFQEHVMDGAPYREDRREVDQSSDVVATLRTEPYGISILSPAFASVGIKALAIDGFTPEPQHVQSGAYLLSRPLLLVSQAHPPSQVKQFIDFMLSPEGQEIVARKFVPVR